MKLCLPMKAYLLLSLSVMLVYFIFTLAFNRGDLFDSYEFKRCPEFIYSTLFSGICASLLFKGCIIILMKEYCCISHSRTPIHSKWRRGLRYILTVIFVGINLWNIYNCYLTLKYNDDKNRCIVHYRRDYDKFWVMSLSLCGYFIFNILMISFIFILKRIVRRCRKKETINNIEQYYSEITHRITNSELNKNNDDFSDDDFGEKIENLV